jgi:lipopolysaccharide/colanic/teichoic acid biosynthesis glycosyltransferase
MSTFVQQIVDAKPSRDVRWLHWDSPCETRPVYHRCKRILDLGLGSALLIVLAPVFLLTALAIKLDSPGPVLFVQDRVGARRRQRNGRMKWQLTTFRFYKFRSMYVDSDSSLHEQMIRSFCQGGKLSHNMDSPNYKISYDSRITRVGRLIRMTSIDELPQLLNVLMGDMSLVGPRPVPIYEVDRYKQPHCARLAALPGITGLWQVKGRGQVPFKRMVAMDIWYARNASLWLDLVLLFQTAPAVLSCRGAR